MSMFSVFRAYDDEGYYLANLGDYLAGHPLLTQFAQVYGPLFYEFFGGLFKLLGVAPTNDSGRIVTVALWLVASAAGGLVAFRLSRNLWLGIAAELLTFTVLSVLTWEPMSTYGLTAVLLLCLAAAATLRSSWPRATAVSIGAIVAALCLIKINVGGLAALGVILAWAASAPLRWRRLLLPVMVGVITALPFLLTLRLLGAGWVLELAVLLALSAAAVGVACLATSQTRSMPPSSGGWIFAGGAVLAIASIGIALAGGTHLADLWNGVVIAPLQFPGLFTLPVRVSVGSDVIAALGFVTAVLAAVRRATPGGSALRSGWLRVCAGIVMWLSVLLLPAPVFLFTVPFAWLASWAPDDGVGDPVGGYARVLLPALAVVECLQAYPVAGSQLSMAGLGLVPVGAVILGDGIRQLVAATAAAGGMVKAPNAVAPTVLVANVIAGILLAFTVTTSFATGTRLGLPGAESIRLQPQSATQLRQLVAAVDRGCSSFITLPGMNSFYIWTAQAPPTPVHTEGWFLVLDSNQQQALVQQLAGKPRLCVIKNQRVLDMWAQGRPIPQRPLVDFIDQEFVHDSWYGDYELLVRADLQATQ
jgi:hypothetical protein